MDDEHDEILRLAEDFCDEDFAEDESFVMKSFAPDAKFVASFAPIPPSPLTRNAKCLT